MEVMQLRWGSSRHGCDSCGKGAAFTIIELLVVIAIIAVLISILLPVISAARSTAHRCASAANLHALAGVQESYATDFKGSFVNPFDAATPRLYPGVETFMGPVSWATTILPATSQTDSPTGLSLIDPERTSEPFSQTWASFMSHYMEGTDQGQKYLYDPADPLIPIHNAIERSSWIDPSEYLFQTSYLYPPVFWLQSSRYRTEQFVPIGPADSEARWLARNAFADVQLASHKVLLFERFDWSVKQRASVDGDMHDQPPQWNNPAARPQVAFVDGSVSRVRVADLHALGESADPSIRSVYRPSGLFDPSPGYSVAWLLGPLSEPASQDPYETGNAPFDDTIAWRAYLYATRNGVHGMDVQKR